MSRPALRHVARALVALLLSVALGVQPLAAQSVLRDAETEAYLRQITAPLVVAAGLEPGNLQVVLLQDNEINAFVAGGQTVYIHSGLFTAASNTNELQGVIAHEIGHVIGGHVLRNDEGARPALAITLLSLLVGAAAMAAGAGDAGMAAMMAGQTAAMGKYLAFSRNQEASADAAGIRILKTAHLSGAGMLSFFEKLRQEEYRLSPTYATIDPFAQTHPMTEDRETTLQDDIKASPYYAAKTDPALDARFLRLKGKLLGFVLDPQSTLRTYPESDQSVPAHYARAYAWHKNAYPDKSLAEVDQLLAIDPHDPYFLELKGQVLLESGRPRDAIAPLREAVARSDEAPLIAATLGHALVATEDPKNLDEAKRVLKVAVARDNQNPFAWYQLGIIYAQSGDEPRAALATAERYSLENQPRLAMASAEMALGGIQQGTPDWIRAQDIALASRGEVDQEKRHH